MLTEGTYPQSFGGVSVWCDQLLRGLSGHQFDVYAITVTGTEEPVWEPPANVSTATVPLWAPPRRTAGRRWPGGVEPVRSAYRDLFRALLAPPETAVPAFASALRRLGHHGAGPDADLVPFAEQAVGWLLEAWPGSAPAAGGTPAPSVLDAVTCVDIIEHWLRPLLRPAPEADVTHAVTNGLAALMALRAKWSHGTPMLLTEHGVYLRERYLGLRESPYSWPVKVVLSSFNRLLCATAYRSADLITPGNRYNHRWETRFGAKPSKIETVYNGVDPADFPAAGREPAVPTISWAGRIDPIKDLETLLRAFVLIRNELPEAKLRIFGGTPAVSRPYKERCEALAGELGAADAVTFEGRVDNIRDAYAAGHVVVLSSISEGFPYTLIEAMTCGRATVSTDVGGVAEAVADTGVVVPPREPAAMAEACLKLLRDDLLRHRLAAAARERALELFTVDQAVDTFDGIYRDLAARRPRRAVQTAVGRARVPIAGRARVPVAGRARVKAVATAAVRESAAAVRESAAPVRESA